MRATKREKRRLQGSYPRLSVRANSVQAVLQPQNFTVTWILWRQACSSWEEGRRICPESMPNPKSLATLQLQRSEWLNFVSLWSRQAAGSRDSVCVCMSVVLALCRCSMCGGFHTAFVKLGPWSKWFWELPARVSESFDKITTTAAVPAVIVVVVEEEEEGVAMRWPTAWYWWVAYSTTDHLHWNNLWNDDDVLGCRCFCWWMAECCNGKVSRMIEYVVGVSCYLDLSYGYSSTCRKFAGVEYYTAAGEVELECGSCNNTLLCSSWWSSCTWVCSSVSCCWEVEVEVVLVVSSFTKLTSQFEATLTNAKLIGSFPSWWEWEHLLPLEDGVGNQHPADMLSELISAPWNSHPASDWRGGSERDLPTDVRSCKTAENALGNCCEWQLTAASSH